ncbi:MAG: IS30 family transposase [Spirochaetia bacterium]|nr:IS30 family transposase [Spirochaetia bacterium]
MSYEHLSDGERRVIEKMRRDGCLQAEIARFLKRSDSTISREISRNDRLNYSAFLAQKRYHREREKCIYTKFSNDKLLKYVLEKISLYWSCEQISGRLEIDFPDDPSMRVSFETIYEHIFRYYPKMFQYFRIKGRYKKPSRGRKSKRKQVIWGTRREITERCKAAATGSEFGHWESDTVEGKKGTGHLVTHVEKKSKLLKMRRVDQKTAKNILEATKKMFKGFARKFLKTMTSDRGREFMLFEEIEKSLKLLFYFAKAYSPWQRPLNENTNGLVRQFCAKGSDFSKYTDSYIQHVEDLINNRPRKILGFKTPNEVFPCT